MVEESSIADARCRAVHVWVKPPGTPLPLTQSPVRFAVGKPSGVSSNSWRAWVQREDTYVACRDSFREYKVSLHASGIWRTGFTEESMRNHPGLVPEGRDRVWKKWRPTLDAQNPCVIGFQLAVPQASLYIHRKDCGTGQKPAAFIEPPLDPEWMTVISVAVVLGHRPVICRPGLVGGVLGVLPLGTDRTVQLVATHERVGDLLRTIEDAFCRFANRLEAPETLPRHGIIFVQGDRNGIPWVAAVPVLDTQLREQ